MTITSPLSPEAQKAAGEALQATLVDLVDLSLVAKQAHWNVVGRNFRSVHLQLDEVVTAARTFADQVAERAAAIAVNPDGRSVTVAAETSLPQVAPTWVSDAEVVEAMVAAMDGMANGLRERISAVGEYDPVTQDLLIEITEAIEQHRWMFQAQTS
jgi:starvation-inducible DNA-binding protein